MLGWYTMAARVGASLLGIGSALAGDGPVRLPHPAPPAQAFRCDGTACAMPDSGSYPHLVIGRFAGSASSEQTQSLFRAMRERGHWPALPGNAAAFAVAVQPVAIALDDDHWLTVLMSQEEAQAAPIAPGDLVRYSPHRAPHERPPTDPATRAAWDIYGCVAVLCRTEDTPCFTRYPAGVFRARDGAALSPRTFQPRRGVPAIDPDTLLPRLASPAGHATPPSTETTP